MKWEEIFNNFTNHSYSHEKEKTIRGFWLCTELDLDLENLPIELTFQPCLYYESNGKKWEEDYCLQKIHVRDIAGTTYKEYSGGTWLDAYCQLHRADYYIEKNLATYNKYFCQLKKKQYSFNWYIRLTKTKDGYYYIDGNGNHRVTMYKLLYFANEYHRKMRSYDVYNPESFWLYAYVRNEL